MDAQGAGHSSIYYQGPYRGTWPKVVELWCPLRWLLEAGSRAGDNFENSLEWLHLHVRGRDSQSSSTTIPSDQQSTFVLYSVPRMSSGAIQNGVPTTDLRVGCFVFSWTAKPKSDSFSENFFFFVMAPSCVKAVDELSV